MVFPLEGVKFETEGWEIMFSKNDHKKIIILITIIIIIANFSFF